MADSAKSGPDKRRWPRVALEARVAISYPSLNELVSGPLVNLSLGGAYIRTTSPKPEGARLWLRVSVAEGGHSFEVRGDVVRVVSASLAREQNLTPGMGIRFVEVDADTQRTIAEVVRAATAFQDTQA